MILDGYYNHSSIIVLYWKRKGQDAEHSAEDKDYDVHFGTTGRQLHCTASQLEIKLVPLPASHCADCR